MKLVRPHSFFSVFLISAVLFFSGCTASFDSGSRAPSSAEVVVTTTTLSASTTTMAPATTTTTMASTTTLPPTTTTQPPSSSTTTTMAATTTTTTMSSASTSCKNFKCGGPNNGCYDNASAKTATCAALEDGNENSANPTIIEYVNADSSCTASSCFKVWRKKGDSKILNATGLWIPPGETNGDWQRQLNRNGSGKIADYLTSNTVSQFTGRACPSSVFVNSSDTSRAGRCLYYDTNNTMQSLYKDFSGSAIQGEDYLASWDSDAKASAYEGNIRTCAEKGMRLPLIGEANGSPDPFLNQVTLKLPMSGADGSAVFTDESPLKSPIKTVGDAKLSASQFKSPATSGLFDGAGDYLDLGSSSNFDLPGDFTIELWIRPETLSSARQSLLGKWSASGLVYLLQITDTVIRFPNSCSQPEVNWTPNVKTWYHIAVTRKSSTIKFWLNGQNLPVAAGSEVCANSLSSSSVNLIVGGNLHVTGEWFNGFMDDVRITKGVARYTSNFTPPVFSPNSSGVPNAGKYTWSSSAYAADKNYYFTWGDDTVPSAPYDYVSGSVRCVLP